MKLTNASSTNKLYLHDALGSNPSEHHQSGVKEVVIAASGTVTLPNTNVAESGVIQDALEAGTVTATQTDLATLPSSGTGINNHPEVPGNILGQGVITWVGLTADLDDTEDYVVGFSAGTAGADKIVRGFDFAAVSEYGACVLAVDVTAGAVATTDIGITKATDSVTFTNNVGTGASNSAICFVIIA